MAPHGNGYATPLLCCVLLLLPTFGHCNLQALVEDIASFDNATSITGTELCIFTTVNSTLAEFAPGLLQRLVARYPTVYLRTGDIFVTFSIKYATMVLLDGTAFVHKFPMRYITYMMLHHPCYQKKAKFVILVSRPAFADRAEIAAMLANEGILNFIIVRVEQEPTTHAATGWTWNQFSKQEQYFKTTDRPVARFYPNKLLDLHGYRFTIYTYDEYPYFVRLQGAKSSGVLVDFFNMIIRKRHNGRTAFVGDAKFSDVTDCRFNAVYNRHNYRNILFFRETTGSYIVCPIQQKREFLQHLLKPFSLAIWFVLGALFVLCRVLQILFPTIYRYDLIGITFFGGGGTEYEQPFQFRIVTFSLVVLLFFLSEAYNTKIISLMSYSKFNVLPHTIDELARSDFQILSPRYTSDLYEHLKLKFIPRAQSQREERRLGMNLYDVYCSVMKQGFAYIAIRSIYDSYEKHLYMIDEPLSPDRNLLQFNFESPFFELFEDYFGRINDAGIWERLLKTHTDMFKWLSTTSDGLQEVIFFFDDLMCVWLLAIAGWMISVIVFFGELAWHKLKRKPLTLKQIRWFAKLKKLFGVR